MGKDAVVIRYAEVLLTYAKAKNEFGLRAAPGEAGVPQQLLHPQRRERKASLRRFLDRLF